MIAGFFQSALITDLLFLKKLHHRITIDERLAYKTHT